MVETARTLKMPSDSLQEFEANQIRRKPMSAETKERIMPATGTKRSVEPADCGLSRYALHARPRMLVPTSVSVVPKIRVSN